MTPDRQRAEGRTPHTAIQLAVEGLAAAAAVRVRGLLALLHAAVRHEASARIGQVTGQHKRMLVARTAMGANRVIPTQIGEQLPRIC